MCFERNEEIICFEFVFIVVTTTKTKCYSRVFRFKTVSFSDLLFSFVLCMHAQAGRRAWKGYAIGMMIPPY